MTRYLNVAFGIDIITFLVDNEGEPQTERQCREALGLKAAQCSFTLLSLRHAGYVGCHLFDAIAADGQPARLWKYWATAEGLEWATSENPSNKVVSDGIYCEIP